MMNQLLRLSKREVVARFCLNRFPDETIYFRECWARYAPRWFRGQGRIINGYDGRRSRCSTEISHRQLCQ